VQDWLTQSARAKSISAPAPAPVAQTPTPTKAPVVAEPAGATPAPAAPRRKLSYKEQRELDALPQRIAALEAEQALVNKELDGGQLYATDPARAAQLAARHAEIEDEWMTALERWEALGGT
jgi:ATP-binding cassette subfamily F protein uup